MNIISEESQNDVNAALPCDRNHCQLPQCWCSEDGTDIPGNLTSPEIPQMITLTFEDAVNPENFDSFISKLSDLCFFNLSNLRNIYKMSLYIFLN